MTADKKQVRLDRLKAEIGSDPAKWSKTCLAPYPRWVENEIDKLIRAVKKSNDGNQSEAELILRSMREKDMTEWYENVGQWAGEYRQNILKVEQGKKISKDMRAKSYISAKIQNELLKRDHYRCRYCQIRVIHKKEIKKLQKMFGLELLPVTKNGKRAVRFRHGVINMLQVSFDHVEPRQFGGENSMGNLVTACHGCNFGKWRWTIDQLGLKQPLASKKSIDGWHGLADLLNSKKS